MDEHTVFWKTVLAIRKSESIHLRVDFDCVELTLMDGIAVNQAEPMFMFDFAQKSNHVTKIHDQPILFICQIFLEKNCQAQGFKSLEVWEINLWDLDFRQDKCYHLKSI